MNKKLENIGFYTLEEKRAKNISPTSPMWRCEMILTDRCNFTCPYCRGAREDVAGVMPFNTARQVIDTWAEDGLRNIRFSGGEPTMYANLLELVRLAKDRGIKRIAISTNGSAKISYYRRLIEAGINDFSVSLDACCSSSGNIMAGTCGYFDAVVENIRVLSELTYVTVGIVLTDDNYDQILNIIRFAHDLGVADIRIISAAQENFILNRILEIEQSILNAYPILKYRVENIVNGRNVRGLTVNDVRRCHLLQDDSVVAGEFHFPCIIYLREQGDPIGKIGPNMRQERLNFFEKFDPFIDRICRDNCLDVCIDFNNRCQKYSSI